MHKVLNNICNSLETFSDELKSVATDAIPITQHTELLTALNHWNQPPFSINELVDMPKLLSEKIKTIDIDIDDNQLKLLTTVPSKLEILIIEGTTNRMFHDEGAQEISVFLNTLNWLENILSPYFVNTELFNSWDVMKEDPNLITKELKKKIVKIEKTIDSVSLDIEHLKNYTKQILDAKKAVDELADDLETAKDTKITMEKLLAESKKDNLSIENLKDEIKILNGDKCITRFKRHYN